ncbi:MAG: hypothetical protein GY820_01440 [Gammaproteobacteria bacterium]|nr:hypothetical protein [Gammaproteobacteria bacterium]
MSEEFTCEECETEFASKFNFDRHMQRYHAEDADDEDSEEEEETEEEENDAWSQMISKVYHEMIQKETHGELSADEILESKEQSKEIINKLLDEVSYVTGTTQRLEEDELYQNLKKSKEKMEEDENYTTEEALAVAWKNRKPSIQQLLYDKKNLLEDELENVEDE